MKNAAKIVSISTVSLLMAILSVNIQAASSAVIWDTTGYPAFTGTGLVVGTTAGTQTAELFSVSGDYSLTKITLNGFSGGGAAAVYAYLCNGKPAAGFPALGSSDETWKLIGSVTSSSSPSFSETLIINSGPISLLSGHTYSIVFAATDYPWNIQAVDPTGQPGAPAYYYRFTSGTVQPQNTWLPDARYAGSLKIEGTDVPEPQACELVFGLGLAGLAGWRKYCQQRPLKFTSSAFFGSNPKR